MHVVDPTARPATLLAGGLWEMGGVEVEGRRGGRRLFLCVLACLPACWALLMLVLLAAVKCCSGWPAPRQGTAHETPSLLHLFRRSSGGGEDGGLRGTTTAAATTSLAASAECYSTHRGPS